MIIALILFGIVLITLALVARYNIKLATALIVPLLYGGYYLVANEVPKYFGYAVPVNFISETQSRFLDGFEGSKNIYIFLIEKDMIEPRLISMPNTPENKKLLKQLQDKAKEGVAVVRKKAKGKDGQGDIGQGNGTDDSDMESVPMKQQDILQK